MRSIMFLPAILLLAMISPSIAQDPSYEDMLRSDVKSGKVKILNETLKMSGKEAELFWPVYRQYDQEKTKIADETYKLIKVYAGNYEQMTNEKAQQLMTESFRLARERIILREKYFKEMQKVLPATFAARFIQVDRQIDLLLDLIITNEIPLVKK